MLACSFALVRLTVRLACASGKGNEKCQIRYKNEHKSTNYSINDQDNLKIPQIFQDVDFIYRFVIYFVYKSKEAMTKSYNFTEQGGARPPVLASIVRPGRTVIVQFKNMYKKLLKKANHTRLVFFAVYNLHACANSNHTESMFCHVSSFNWILGLFLSRLLR